MKTDREKLIELINDHVCKEPEIDAHCLDRGSCNECLADYLISKGVTIPVRMPVVGYEGYYEVDQFGRVYGLDRVITVNDNGRVYNKPVKAGLMKQHMHSNGYKVVSLTKNGKTKNCYVHRIAAEAFIPNAESLPMVNHKGEDKTNNFVENLEWCTNEYNLSYGQARQKQAAKIRGIKHSEERKQKTSEALKKAFRENAKIKFEYEGEMLSIPELSEKMNIPAGTLRARYRRTGNVFRESDFCSCGERKEE
jgi:hypothetical protein